MEKRNIFHLIYLRSSVELILSKKQYSNWREIQDEYEDYMTSLGPWSEEELIEFFRLDLGEDEEKWPFSLAQIRNFMNSSEPSLWSTSSA